MNIIVNETGLKQFGYSPATTIGRKVRFSWDWVSHYMTIVGIVKDFNFKSLHTAIQPLAFSTLNFFGNANNFLIAKVQTRDMASAISYMGDVWKKINPAVPFSFSFIDQDFAKNYEREQRTSTLVLY